MTIYVNYMAKPREKKRTCILETCSKSNNYIPNATPPSHLLFKKNVNLTFFFKLTKCLTHIGTNF